MITSGVKFGEMLADSVFRVQSDQAKEDLKVAKTWAVEPARFSREKLLLHIWATELAVTRAVGASSQHRQTILGGFFHQVESMALRMRWSSVLSDITVRGESYSDAYNRPHELGVAYTVGKAFALACNSEMDAAVILLGAEYFAGYVSNTEDLTRIWQRDYS